MSDPIPDTRALRDAFGAFMTGVTIVTSAGENGRPVGLTANAFTSVSLSPPLLLVCISQSSQSLQSILRSGHFAVNILAEGQKTLADQFARPADDRYSGVGWKAGPLGSPVLDGVCGWFDCRIFDQKTAGDHLILIGQVAGFSHSRARPLGYSRGGYVFLDN